MSKYPFFGKKGRPSAVEQEICRKVNNLIESGEIKQSKIDSFIKTNGVPETEEALNTFYETVVGEPLNPNKVVRNQSQSDSYEDEDFDNDYSVEDEDIVINSGKVESNPDAVSFSPFSDPVIERSYTNGIPETQDEDEDGGSASDESESDVKFDDKDFEKPADEITDVEFEEQDIPEPDFARGMTQEEQEEEEQNLEDDEEFQEKEKLGGDNLQDLSPAQKRKSAEKTAEAILDMYCNFAPLPFKKWSSISDSKVQKLKFENKIDLSMQLENNVTVKDYIDGVNENVDEIFTVSEETRESIKDPLIDVLLEQELALTPTQRLLMAVGTHVVTMGFSAYQLAQNNKLALESFEKYHQQMNNTRNPFNNGSAQQTPPPQQTKTYKAPPTETFNPHDKEVVEELMRQMNQNEDDDDILDDNDPSIEITEE